MQMWLEHASEVEVTDENLPLYSAFMGRGKRGIPLLDWSIWGAKKSTIKILY